MNSMNWFKDVKLPNDFEIDEYLNRPWVKMYHGASKKTRTVRHGCPLYKAMIANQWTNMGEVKSHE